MSWLRHHIAWVWPAALVVGLALVVIIRVWSGWADRPMASLASETDGVVSGESDGLVAAARRIRALQSQSAATRQQLAALQNDSVGRRRCGRSRTSSGRRPTRHPPNRPTRAA